MKHSVQVTILGQQYTIKSQLAPEEVRKVADFVNGKLAEVEASHKVVDTLNTAVLALLNVAGEYLDLSAKEQADEDARQRLESLAEKLDKACEQSGKSG
ncbi:MAG: cell division protein ZapA [Desulfuromonadales bacterium]|nr:cell division protein ZapA [Desulfuromonadales bacterium]NIR33010.1 cell division protein ZapA [Desulfuromonadales bacterium]NIS40559.1 cell division protein ZapA [Desulfuromonadales bacterium]